MPSLIGWIFPLKEVKDVYRMKYLLVLPAIVFELSKRTRVSSLPLTLPEQWPLSNIRRLNPRHRLIDITYASWRLHDPTYMSQHTYFLLSKNG